MTAVVSSQRTIYTKGAEFADVKNVHPYEFLNQFRGINFDGGTHCSTIAYVRTQLFRNSGVTIKIIGEFR